MSHIVVGKRRVGEGSPVFIIAEIGINHNGSLEQAKGLIDVALSAGCDAVKFQKRTVEVVYTPDQLAEKRQSVFGTTNEDLKLGLELSYEAYCEIDLYCKEKGILWFASPWDEGSVDFLETFSPPCYKIASASLTDDHLLSHIASKGRPVILSTGMSTMEQVRKAVSLLQIVPLAILHCVSTYPAKPKNINLSVMETLAKEFPSHPIGYSGHENGIGISVAAVGLGACIIERHITLDKNLWGSDQKASMDPSELGLLVREIRDLEHVHGDGVKRVIEEEVPIAQKLRRVK